MSTPSPLLLGWAATDVTPDRPVNLYGQFHMRIAKTVRDPVTVTVLAISPAADPTQGVLLAAADTCVIPGEVLQAVRARVAERFPGIPVRHLMLHSTHTHTAPDLKGDWHPHLPPGVMTPAEYVPFFVDRVATAIGEAWAARRPGALSWGNGYAVLSHNRRTIYKEDISLRTPGKAGYAVNGFGKLYGATNDPAFSHMEGSEDHRVNALFTWDAERRLTGIVVNVPCPSQETEGLSEISADFWHEVRQELRRRHGDQLYILPQDSAAGGLSPHLMIEKRAEERMLALKGRTSRQELARRLADACDEILAWCRKDLRHEVDFAVSHQLIRLPMRRITDAEYAQVAAQAEELRRQPGETAPLGRCERVMQRYRRQQAEPDLPFELLVVRLGDIAMATNSFELFTDFGLQIKARSPALQTFLIQHVGSEGHLGGGTYLPTAEAERNKGYSATIYCNVIGHEGGEVLVEETLAALHRLFPTPA